MGQREGTVRLAVQMTPEQRDAVKANAKLFRMTPSDYVVFVLQSVDMVSDSKIVDLMVDKFNEAVGEVFERETGLSL